MADYQLNQPGPTIQQAIDIALQTQSLLSQEATARINGDNQRATIAQLEADRKGSGGGGAVRHHGAGDGRDESCYRRGRVAANAD